MILEENLQLTRVLTKPYIAEEKVLMLNLKSDRAFIQSSNRMPTPTFKFGFGLLRQMI